MHPQVMLHALSNAFAAGSGVAPATMKFVIVSICAAVVLLVALWLVNRIVADYRANDIEAHEAAHSLASVALPVVVLLVLLAWL
ncbi:DUF3262 family protein [Pseudorhodoferax soli]|uniref:Integrating conjugative element protein (TIGR03758 family) n=1 Tax=Pseudorhodoferax soli TaxID=545864 RepID=A0A368XE07_9BURK|nr:DUF3262 family protein [Pseudorhodoferax soli]RCW66203.1 integrating conjugative element protein (TIGR03758 family) [Pseudorhodoferax soli]